MLEIPLTIAFTAGLVSFLAPCVLPLIPSFITYLAGTSLNDATVQRKAVFIHGLLYVLGFSSVFAILGVALNTILEAVAYDASVWLARIGGIIIIFFGLYLTGLFHIYSLERGYKIRFNNTRFPKYLSSFLFGAAFAAGWTPCAGAALGSILGLAASEPGSAFILLLAYAAGFSLPFLIISLFISQAKGIISRLIKVIKPLQVIFGLILIVFGLAVFTQTISRYANLDIISRILN